MVSAQSIPIHMFGTRCDNPASLTCWMEETNTLFSQLPINFSTFNKFITEQDHQSQA